MKFLDASAVVPLLLEEATSEDMRELYRRDRSLAVWWTTEVECVGAVTRIERENPEGRPAAVEAIQRLDELAGEWIEVQPIPSLRTLARRLIRVHALRLADCLQLAAALTVTGEAGGTRDFVCLDRRLSEAAIREGLRAVPSL